jgi:Ca2+-binding RTX toxin-like protein
MRAEARERIALGLSAFAAPPPEDNMDITGTDGDDTLIRTAGDDAIDGFADTDLYGGSEVGGAREPRAEGLQDTLSMLVASQARDLHAVAPASDAREFNDGPVAEDDITAVPGGPFDLYGTQGDDTMHAAPAGNQVWGYGGDDVLYGGIGFDNLIGGDGHDVLYGGDGSDSLQGMAGADDEYGESGDDTFWISSATDLIGDRYDGGAGMDQINVTLNKQSDNVNFSAISLVSIERLFYIGNGGTPSTLVFTPTQVAGLNYFLGGANIKFSAPGSVDLSGAIINSTWVFRLADGANSLTLPGGYFQPAGSAPYTEHALVFGGNGADVIIGGNVTYLYGNDGDDTLIAGSAAGSTYAATIDGGRGIDHLVGGPGDDSFQDDPFDPVTNTVGGTIDGKGGHDSLRFTNGTILSLSGADGTILWSSGNSGIYDLDGSAVIARISVNQGGQSYVGNVSIVGIESIAGITIGTPLFTAQGDEIDFNALTPGAAAAITSLASSAPEKIYLALEGNDIVTLPNSSTLSNQYAWNSQTSFNGGAGDDLIKGGALSDIIDGGSGNDTISGSVGNDQLRGGAGDDIFNFSALDLSHLSGSQTVNGGSGTDTLRLPGHATDYTFTANIAANGEQHTTISTSSGFNIDAVNVEKVTFQSLANNVVTGNAVSELVALANEAYGAHPPSGFLTHFEPILGQVTVGPVHDDTADAARSRGWHILSALELGMQVSGATDRINYSFVDGLFQAVVPSEPFLSDLSEANAIVMTGLVDGKMTLTIAFRGTDQTADFGDYSVFTTEHYAKYKPLIDAIDSYVADTNNGIRQVFLAGHSLGGAMVQTFLAEHADGHGVEYRGVTIGSPGSDAIGNAYGRLMNFGNTDDPVFSIAPLASGISDKGSALLAITGFMLGLGLGLSDLVTVADRLAEVAIKHREGSEILINSQVSSFYSMKEHSGSLYATDIGRLLKLADLQNGSTHFANSELGASLRSGAIYTGQRVQIALNDGGILHNRIFMSKNDDWVFGGPEDESIYWNKNALSQVFHDIDGGSGRDTLYLPGHVSDWNLVPASDGGVKLFYQGTLAANLAGIERLVIGTSSATPIGSTTSTAAAGGVPIIYLTGTPVVQTVSSGTTTVTIQPNVDYLLAGDGNVAITGTAGPDTILLGKGTQSVVAGAGDDTVMVEAAAEGAVGLLAITGGAGNDTIIGDDTAPERVTAIYSGSRSDYLVTIDGDNGVQLFDQRLNSPDGLDTLSKVSFFQFADGSYTLDQLAQVNVVGTDGNDILVGSTTIDRLAGGKGDDFYFVDNRADLIFENAGEGTDSAQVADNFYLYANIENLTLAAGAGNIFGVGNELANIITGNEGDNTLLAGAGVDVVHAGAGVDIVYGESGDDQLFGDAGNDFLAGGIGNDTIDGGAGGDSVYGEAGNDVLYGGSTFEFDILVGGDGNDVLHGDSGMADYDYLYGNAGDDSFYVDTGDDLTFENVGEGTDTVYANVAGANNGVYLYANIENLVLLGTTTFGVGNELNNVMTGNVSGNYLLGGAGDDVLNGKAGNDVLFGQAGADRFVFEHGTGGDVIGDFAAGTDKIDLIAIGYSWAQVQNSMHENGGNTAIDLGGGDLVVLNGVTAAQLHASDFLLASGTATVAAAQGVEEFQAALDVLSRPRGAHATVTVDGHGAIAHSFLLDGADGGMTPVAFIEPSAIDHGTALIA